MNPSGSDSNAGSAGSPFRTIARGVSQAAPGDTVLLQDGTYGDEGHISDGTGCYYGCQSPVYINNAGYSSAWITVKAQNKGKAILDCGTYSSSSLGCDVYIYLGPSAQYWSFQDLVVQGGAFGGITSNDSASHIRITGTVFQFIGNYYTSSTVGIAGVGFAESTTDWWIEGNTFHDIGRTGGLPTLNHDHGIYACGSSATIINNVFYSNNAGYDIQTSHGANNWLIANNTFAFPAPHPGHIMLWDGEVAYSIWNITIRNNIFYHPLDVAVVTYSDVGTDDIPGCAIDHNLTSVDSLYDNGMSCSVSDNEVATDPMLQNVSTEPYDFHLQPGSPAIGWGLSLASVVDDILGNLRSATSVDLGAFAYTTSQLSSVTGTDTSGTDTSGTTSTAATSSSNALSNINAILGITTTGPVPRAVSDLRPVSVRSN